MILLEKWLMPLQRLLMLIYFLYLPYIIYKENLGLNEH